VNREQERLIDALLTLARSQRGLSRRVLFDLGEVAAHVVRTAQADPALQVRVRSSLAAAPVAGDPALAERLVTNLVENAIRYNVPDGTVDVTVEVSGARSVLHVTNTGPALPPDQIDRLFQPFQRLGRERTGHEDARRGLGLGLSIVAAVAASHGATLTARPGDGGGLDVRVGFPTAVGSPARRPAHPGR
jgi:signal transduction histidine kinase